MADFKEVVKPEQVLIIEPKKELYFKGPYNETASALIKLTNPLNQRVVFKVKTTAPKRYCVRPNSGVIEPNTTQVVTVMFQPLDTAEQASDKSKHKFMIQTLVEPEGCEDLDRIWKLYSNQTMDSKLKCVFDEPTPKEKEEKDRTLDEKKHAEPSPPKGADADAAHETVDDDTSAKQASTDYDVMRILEEVKRIREENASLKQRILVKEGITYRGEKLKADKRAADEKKTDIRAYFGNSQVFSWIVALNLLIFMFAIGVLLGKIYL